MSRRRDTKTLDLLAWEPPVIVQSFPAEKIRAADLRVLVAKVVSLALKDCASPREEIANTIGDWLGENCTEAMLNAYSSEARGDKVPSLVRFIGIAHATGAAQPMLQAVAELFDLAVIPTRYVSAVEDAMLSDRVEELQHRQRVKRREWKGAR
jgi:hypothetical protein